MMPGDYVRPVDETGIYRTMFVYADGSCVIERDGVTKTLDEDRIYRLTPEEMNGLAYQPWELEDWKSTTDSGRG